MYGIFTYIYHKNQPNVGKYTIHGSYGYMLCCVVLFLFFLWNGEFCGMNGTANDVIQKPSCSSTFLEN